MDSLSQPRNADDVRGHVCGWSGPGWLHMKRLCHTCKGYYPTPDGDPQNYGPVCRLCWPEQFDGEVR